MNYGVAVLPTVSATGRPAKPFMGSEGLLLSAKSNHKEEAFAVMDYLTGLESAKLRLSEGKQTVATAAAYQGATDPMIQVFRAQLDNSVPMPNTPQMLMVWSPVTTALNKVVNGGGDPAAALKTAQAQIEQAIKSSRR
jgi:arabinogalactan oligomer/maltooligosaccharide transport system substrate-binding protein